MLNALSVRMVIVGSFLCRSRAVMIAASSALLMVWRSGCDLISMCVVVPVLGSTTEAPSVWFPFIWDPSVYM